MLAAAVVMGLIVAAVPVAFFCWSLRSARGTAEAVHRRQGAPALVEELPYWSIEDDGTAVCVDGTYIRALELHGRDPACCSDETLEQIQSALHAMLLPLPTGTLLQFLYRTDHDTSRIAAGYASTLVPETPFDHVISDAKLNDVEERAYLRNSHLHLVLIRPPLPGASGRFQAPDEATHERRVRELAQMASQITSALGPAGIQVRPVAGDGLRDLCYRSLNPGRAQTVAAPKATRGTAPDVAGVAPVVPVDPPTERERLCKSNIRSRETTLEVDGHLLRTIVLEELPEYRFPGALQQLTLGVPYAAGLQFTVELVDHQKTLDALKGQRKRAANANAHSGQRNHEAEARLYDLESLIQDAVSGSMRFVRVGLVITLSVSADGPGAQDALENQTQDMLRRLALMDSAQGVVAKYAQLDTYLSTLPGNAAHRDTHWHLVRSDDAAALLPVWQSWPGHQHARILLETGWSHLVGVDPFDTSLASTNLFIAGESGSGKSVLTNYIMMHMSAGGCDVIIIDRDGSYQRFVELRGGEYFSFANDADPALNLFYEPEHALRPDGSLAPKLGAGMKRALETLLTDPDRPRLSPEEKMVLDVGLQWVYQGRQPGDPAPLLSDLQSVLQAAVEQSTFSRADQHAIADRFAERLRYWTTGLHARLLDRPTNVGLRSRFAAFDLKGLDDEVAPTVMTILSGLVWDFVTSDKKRRKFVVYDEAWKLLDNPAVAPAIEEQVRTARKYTASLLFISQSAEDFLNCSISTALVGNCPTRLLLSHQKGHESLQRVFELNDQELAVFKGLETRKGEYSEMLALVGKNHFLGRNVLNAVEYWMTTTHGPDVSYLDQLAESIPDLFDRIRYAAQHYPRGVSAAVSFATSATAA